MNKSNFQNLLLQQGTALNYPPPPQHTHTKNDAEEEKHSLSTRYAHQYVCAPSAIFLWI